MENKETCKWKLDIYSGDGIGYITECEYEQIFIVDGFKENSYKFCPYCGKEIEESKDDR